MQVITEVQASGKWNIDRTKPYMTFLAVYDWASLANEELPQTQ